MKEYCENHTASWDSKFKKRCMILKITILPTKKNNIPLIYFTINWNITKIKITKIIVETNKFNNIGNDRRYDENENIGYIKNYINKIVIRVIKRKKNVIYH